MHAGKGGHYSTAAPALSIAPTTRARARRGSASWSLALGMIQRWKTRVGRFARLYAAAGAPGPVTLRLRFGLNLHGRDGPPPNFFLVARRISFDSLRSFTALASTSA